MIDAFLIATMYITALGIRLLDSATADTRAFFSLGLIRILPLVIIIHIGTNIAFGAYGHIWEYASVAEAKRVITANMAATAIIWAGVETYRLVADKAGPIPRASIPLAGLLIVAAMGMVRFRTRLFSFGRGLPLSPQQVEQPADRHERMLVVGLNKESADAVRRLEVSDSSVQVVGFVVNDFAGPIHGKLAGVKVLGVLEQLPTIIKDHQVDQVLVSDCDEAVARKVLDLCTFNDVRLRILPGVDKVLTDSRAPLDIRDLVITDLLPRPAVSTDLADVRALIAGSRVLVTGAGGSIGSEIVRQVQAFAPAEVFALDHDETHLYDASLVWSSRSPIPRPLLCDIRDRPAVRRLFDEIRPHIVFHASALKHVPILEESPYEALKTNVLGTQSVIEASASNDVEHFVLISTDKAVKPCSVMGASKRLAELLVLEANQAAAGRYNAVRFGNVLGSRGSVVPTFIRQIQNGGPVTITDPEMTRYFMTIDEAVQLVLQATSLEDSGQVFVLDMDTPVRISDLAHRLIRLSGLVPGRDIAIKVVGRRPGEKLTEELAAVPLEETRHTKIRTLFNALPPEYDIGNVVAVLEDFAEHGSGESLRTLMVELANATWSDLDLNLALDDESEVGGLSSTRANRPQNVA